MRVLCALLGLLCLSIPVRGLEADAWLDEVGQRLAWSSADGGVRARLSGSLDLDAFAYERPPPGVLNTEAGALLQPRLTLFLDLQAGASWYAFAQARVDRGFDPSDEGLRGRLDEFALRYTPWQDGRLSVQAGQFATVIGGWVQRHLPKDNPFVSAPLPYENLTRLSDLIVPGDARDLTYPIDNYRYAYNPVIWGPAYTTGVAASGRAGAFEWALELKNAPPFARPSAWSLRRTGFGEPTWSGRIGWRPNLQWNLGLSVSEGAFLSEDAYVWGRIDRGDYRQALYLFDFSYALHHLELWGEFSHARFSLPGIQSLTTQSWFLEARYRFSPGFSAAARWNEQQFSTITVSAYRRQPWGGPVRRLDLAGTWRLAAHIHFKLEVNLRQGEDSLAGLGWGGAAQLSVRF